MQVPYWLQYLATTVSPQTSRIEGLMRPLVSFWCGLYALHRSPKVCVGPKVMRSALCMCCVEHFPLLVTHIEEVLLFIEQNNRYINRHGIISNIYLCVIVMVERKVICIQSKFTTSSQLYIK